MSGRKAAAVHAAKSVEEALSLQDIIDGMQDQVLVIGDNYRVRLANDAACRYAGAKKSTVHGGLCYRVLQNRRTPCAAPLWTCPLLKVFSAEKSISLEHTLSDAGATRHLRIIAYPLKDENGRTRAIVELRRDVTAEKELESQILRRHHQLRTLSLISGSLSTRDDLTGILERALDNVLEIIKGAIGGILLVDERTQTLHYKVHRGFTAQYAEEMSMSLGEGIAGRVAQSGQPLLLEDISQDNRAVRLDLVSAEGLKSFISIPLRSQDRVLGVMNIASTQARQFKADDVSLLSSIGDYLGTAIEQARLNVRLAREGERYRDLLRHALTAQEDERKRIARELHDDTSQALTSVMLNIQALLQLAEMKGFGDAAFLERMKKAHSAAIYASSEIVKLMKELRPTLLDELGMPAAIHRYAHDTLETKGIGVHTDFKGADARLRPEVEVTLFRVAQGAIGNILEHSEAKNAYIELECDSRDCKMNIIDDGCGFDVSRVTRVDPSGRGAGLFTMKERIRLVGGACLIESRQGKGTRVRVRIPRSADVVYEEY